MSAGEALTVKFEPGGLELVVPSAGDVVISPVRDADGSDDGNLFTVEWGPDSVAITEDRCTLNPKLNS
ncbi:hypothetical protein [Nocardia sp. NPDC058666]|uniref:hypothetical protein n=1 Tax=Nocardia sp. NPDC058666 TaxID=3346587 RepID=UPI00366578FA